MERRFTETVDEKYAGKMIKTLMREKYKMSSSLIKQLKNSEDGITVNGKREKVIYTLKKGDNAAFTLREGASETIEPVEGELNIVYEDEDILIVDKAAGVPVHPSQGHHGNTLANALMYYYSSKGEDRVFRAVNRLDKGTSGLMCIAKNSYAHERLCSQLHTNEFERKYLCVVEGTLTGEGIIDAPIGRSGESIIKRCVTPEGQSAVTEYRAREHKNNKTLVEVVLKSGRTHQIRVHMAYIGHPLTGDWLYGEENREIIIRPALHSYFISLVQPISGKKLEFLSKIPSDMEGLLKN